jgi:hypothetical protein
LRAAYASIPYKTRLSLTVHFVEDKRHAAVMKMEGVQSSKSHFQGNTLSGTKFN